MSETTENENSAILEVAKSIGGEGFVAMATEYIQGLLMEEEVDEADLMEMTSLYANQINFEDARSDEDCAVKNSTFKKFQEGL